MAPSLNHDFKLGQQNTTILCPAFTTHAEHEAAALHHAGIDRTKIQIVVRVGNPEKLISHFISTVLLAVDPFTPGFYERFLSNENVDQLMKLVYLGAHSRYLDELLSMEEHLH